MAQHIVVRDNVAVWGIMTRAMYKTPIAVRITGYVPYTKSICPKPIVVEG